MKKVVKTLLVDPSGDILFLVRGATHPRFAHEADLSGGIVENNESIRDALIREVLEECGIDINDKKIYKVAELEYNPNWHYALTLVVCESLLPKLSWEHEGYFMCNIKDIESNAKISQAKDPYMKFVYKTLCLNNNRLANFITKLKD